MQERLSEPPVITAQYETLRLSALGEPLQPETRSGLTLFLRRGMWGWAKALSNANAPQQLNRTLPSNSTESHEYRAIIQVFAAMALSSNKWKTR